MSKALEIADMRGRLETAERELSITMIDPASSKQDVCDAVLLVRLVRANLEITISPPQRLRDSIHTNVVAFRPPTRIIA